MQASASVSVAEINATTAIIVDKSYRVHRELGPGLLESVYHRCLEYELNAAGLWVQSHVPCPIAYGEVQLNTGFTLDLLVNDAVIVVLKAVERVHPIHQAQLMTYLRLRTRKVGLLINFNVVRIKDGITRVVNGL